MAGQLISPKLTGGVGYQFEYLVATIMLSRMIRGAIMPVGTELPVHMLGFQQRNSGYPLDDFVAHARPRDKGPVVRIQFQVKTSFHAQAKNAEFCKTMTAAVEACTQHPEDVRNGRLLLGLAAVEPASGLKDLADLADMARAEDDSESLGLQLRKGVTGERLRVLHETVGTAIASAVGADSALDAEDMTFRVLERLHIWRPLVEDDGRDWRTELDALSDMAAQVGLASTDLLDHLYKLACFYDKHGGRISAARVRQQLLSEYGLDLPLPEESSGRPSSANTVNVYGNGPTWVAQTQTFPNLNFGSS